jgi:transposase-like protein
MEATVTLGVERASPADGRRRCGARRNAGQWARIIEAQRRSELTVVEFCRRRGIAKATFWYWRKRLVTSGKRVPVAQPVPGFLEMPIMTSAPERIEVDVGAMRVRLEGAAAARVVEAIVARVGSGAA